MSKKLAANFITALCPSHSSCLFSWKCFNMHFFKSIHISKAHLTIFSYSYITLFCFYALFTLFLTLSFIFDLIRLDATIPSCRNLWHQYTLLIRSGNCAGRLCPKWTLETISIISESWQIFTFFNCLFPLETLHTLSNHWICEIRWTISGQFSWVEKVLWSTDWYTFEIFFVSLWVLLRMIERIIICLCPMVTLVLLVYHTVLRYLTKGTDRFGSYILACIYLCHFLYCLSLLCMGHWHLSNYLSLLE